MKVAELITGSRSLHKMKLGTLRKLDTAVIAQIPRDQVRLLWSDDWYDGPISGMAQVQGARYLFEMIDRDVHGAEEEHRKYWLIELNADQLNEEVQWQLRPLIRYPPSDIGSRSTTLPTSSYLVGSI